MKELRDQRGYLPPVLGRSGVRHIIPGNCRLVAEVCS
jgi:hypothetical protein